MNSLWIRLFGCPSISISGGQTLRKPGRSAERLLGYLVLNGERLHPREKLATLLWQDASPEQARNALKTTLWRLRKHLEPNADTRGRFITVSGSAEIGLNWTQDIRSDVTTFTAALTSHDTNASACPRQLHDSLRALKGELLEGFYDDWIIAERERLNTARARALGILMQDATQRGALTAALEFGRDILARDPLRESVHREMIRLHLRQGHRIQALRQYEACAQIMRQELGINPMPETLALKAQILALDPPDAAAPTRPEIVDAMARVNCAMDQLAQTHAELTQQLHWVDQLTGSK